MLRLTGVSAALLATLTLAACGTSAQPVPASSAPTPTPLLRAQLSDVSASWDALHAWSLYGHTLVYNPNAGGALSVDIDFRFLSPEGTLVASCTATLFVAAGASQDAACLLGNLSTIHGLVYYIPRRGIPGECYPDLDYCFPATPGGPPLKVGSMEAILVSQAGV